MLKQNRTEKWSNPPLKNFKRRGFKPRLFYSMRVVIQRVSSAQVAIEGQIVSQIKQGILVLVGIAHTDTPDDVAWLARKVIAQRIFTDSEDHMNLSVGDVGGEILAVSQFTLIASTRKGTRPSFNAAATPALAVPLYEKFVHELSEQIGHPIKTGMFGADMKVSLINDGPVTLVIDSQLRE